MSNIKVLVANKHYPHKTFVFSGGEVQVRLSEDTPRVPCPYYAVIRADIRNSDDIMETFLVTDALYRKYPGISVKLLCPYFPYARQDRVCHPGEAFSAHVMCNLVNAQGYVEVEVWDAHSDIILRHGIPRVVNKEAWELIEEWGELEYLYHNCHVVAPDKGALGRATAVSDWLNSKRILAEKIRNPENGQITDTVVHFYEATHKDFLIVDDICDGGRTFVELAKKLRPLTTGRIYLYVTHGIFSAGFDVFRGLIDHIYVANCFPTSTPDDLVSVRPA